MGAWSVTLFGNDGVLDEVINANEILHNDGTDESIVLHSKKESVQEDLCDHILKTDDDYKWEAVHAIIGVIMQAGGYIGKELKSLALQYADDPNLIYWNDPDERAEVIEDFKEKLKAYQTGKKVTFESESLFSGIDKLKG
jgi:hypothetical protein